nr:MAG TPA: hypothetical protein [Caudoviricetes sp.]
MKSYCPERHGKIRTITEKRPFHSKRQHLLWKEVMTTTRTENLKPLFSRKELT